MTYRPVEIEVRREGFIYMAYIISRDDNDEGMGVEQGPYCRLSHRWAWKRAYRAAGRRLWPRLEA